LDGVRSSMFMAMPSNVSGGGGGRGGAGAKVPLSRPASLSVLDLEGVEPPPPADEFTSAISTLSKLTGSGTPPRATSTRCTVGDSTGINPPGSPAGAPSPLHTAPLSPGTLGDAESQMMTPTRRKGKPPPPLQLGGSGRGDGGALVVGDLVTVKGYSCAGTVRFVGPHKTKGSMRCGIELDEAVGKNDGTVGGEVYFSAKPDHGVLVVPEKCSLASPQPLSPPPMSPVEPPMSPKPEEVYIATHTYESTSSEELTFVKGQLLVQLSKLDEGWYFGEIESSGKKGLIPANYVALHQLDLKDAVLL